MAKSGYFLLFIGSFLVGIVVCDFLVEADYVKAVFVVFISCVFVWRFFCDVGKKLCFVFLFFFFGFFRFFFAIACDDADVASITGDVQLKGDVCDEVDVRDDKVKYVVCAEEVFVQGKKLAVQGRVLVNAERYPVYEYGDFVLAKGKLQRPGMIDDFSYDKYLSRYGIYSVMYFADVEVIFGGKSSFMRFLYSFKNSFESKLFRIFSEPHGSLMAGLLLGSRKGISADLMRKFSDIGLTHILAVSGYNITLVISFVGVLFGFCSRKYKIIFSSVFVVLFVLLVGASASVVRAAVMGIVSLLALWFGREYFVKISLFSAAFFMCLFNPKVLVFDVGFQLSFLATFGIVFISPLLIEKLKMVPDVFCLREGISLTLSAQVFVLPITILNFGGLSFISPLANVLIVPFVPLAMLFGFLSTVFGCLFDFLGVAIGFFGYVVLEIVLFFVDFFSSMKFAYVEMPWFSWWGSVFYYYLVFILFCK